MDFFRKVKSVKLKSRHNKYLTAGADDYSVFQEWSEKSTEWMVEFVERAGGVVRLRSCSDKYLMALDEEFLLGVTGKKVVLTLPAKMDSLVEWEPIRDGMQIKLKTRYANYICANGSVPLW